MAHRFACGEKKIWENIEKSQNIMKLIVEEASQWCKNVLVNKLVFILFTILVLHINRFKFCVYVYVFVFGKKNPLIQKSMYCTP